VLHAKACAQHPSPIVATDRRAVRLIRGERLMTINNSVALPAGEAAKLLGLAPSALAKLRLGGNGTELESRRPRNPPLRPELRASRAIFTRPG
jgi:hypothetical protein